MFTSPHSGRNYDADFIALTRLDLAALRRSEDCFVDELFSAAAQAGAPLLVACFPRAFCDVNRAAWELDPDMFLERIPDWVNTRNPRAQSGLGTIARVVGTNQPIYGRKLTFADARQRIATCWIPFHRELQRLVKLTQAEFGACLIVDCHSMPALSDGSRAPQFVIGDAHGTSCAPVVTETLERGLRAFGYRVTRNTPYAGGYITTHYGRPEQRVHTVQLEIARSLYMDEEDFNATSHFPTLQTRLDTIIRGLIGVAATLR